MHWPDQIVLDPEIAAGKPIIRGTRLTVELILGMLGAGESEAAILSYYPNLTHEDLVACIAFASYLVREFRAFPLSA
jgi:uncharacterized protein (DUF433 family)